MKPSSYLKITKCRKCATPIGIIKDTHAFMFLETFPKNLKNGEGDYK